MKKIISLCIGISLLSGICVNAQETNSGVKLNIDGETKYLSAYNIKDNNYFKLRDVANALKGTEAQFDVIWNEEKNAIELLSATAYSTDEELTGEVLRNPTAVSSYVSVYKDGGEILLNAYNIADNNYFKLRDLAAAIDFGVEWNQDEQVIEIVTDKSYEYPDAQNTDFALNTQYLSMIGKTKAEIDAILGDGDYSMEFGMTDYGNGVSYSWNSIGTYPEDSSVAITAIINLDNLFFNCPENVTEEHIKSVFNGTAWTYDEMDDQNVLLANYCGKSIMFFPDYGLTPEKNAFLNIFNPYTGIENEVIQIINSSAEENKPTADFYAFALENESKFKEYNASIDYREDGKIYSFADVDHDGEDELVVDIYFGVAVYKNINGNIEEIYFQPNEISGGSWGKDLVKYNGEYYIRHYEGNSSEICILSVVGSDEKIDSYKLWDDNGYDVYYINDEEVDADTYYNHTEAIEYAAGQMTIEELK